MFQVIQSSSCHFLMSCSYIIQPNGRKSCLPNWLKLDFIPTRYTPPEFKKHLLHKESSYFAFVVPPFPKLDLSGNLCEGLFLNSGHTNSSTVVAGKPIRAEHGSGSELT